MDVLIAFAWFFAPWAAMALLLAGVAPLRLSGLFGLATIVGMFFPISLWYVVPTFLFYLLFSGIWLGIVKALSRRED